MAPVEALKVPAPQREQVAALAPDQLPAAQGVGVREDSGQKDPAGQGTGAPEEQEKPAGQGTQVSWRMRLLPRSAV